MKNFPFKEICFICTANECRSPMAEKIFAHILKQNGVKGLKVSSAGLNATGQIEMTLKAKRALKTLGINAGAKKSQQLTKLSPTTLYITMEQMHKNAINKENVLTFASIVGGEDILDPYGQSQESYNKTAAQINYYCLRLFEKIKKSEK